MFLVVGEKPSVAQALAKALSAAKRGDGYFSGKDCAVSWCLGHLAEYAPPEAYDKKYEKWEFSDLPILPGKWELSVAKGKEKQLEVLKKLFLSGFDYIVNGCDAGREGELIFRRVYELSGSRTPVKRLWISSMEDAAIREGFAHLKNGEDYRNLYEASICRAKADWLVGMNATRAFTTKYHKRLAVGRVQTPTLAMLVERQEKIDSFVKEAFYRVEISGAGLTLVSGDIREKADADALAGRCRGNAAVVTRAERKRRRAAPPKLYDLTTLQREANRFFGYTAQETLQGLQELYEGRLATYPRTDSQYVTADMGQTVMELLEALPGLLPFLPADKIGRDIGRITDNGKVSDHHALLPTREALKKDIGSLPEKNRNILLLIGQRLAQAVSGDCVYEETEVTAKCGGQEFRAKGRTVADSGFQGILSAFRAAVQAGKPAGGDGQEENAAIPEGIHEGMEIPSVHAAKTEHFTAPLKPYTEDTLLSSMERAGNREFDEGTEKKGLGTPATRASVIEKLISSGYAARKGKQIIPTDDGKELVAVLPDYLKSPSMTAEWEKRLLQMEKGQLGGGEFMEGVYALIGEMLEWCRAIPEGELRRFHPKESIGPCPACGSPVYEGERNFYCSGTGCPFALWKENRYLSGMRKKLDRKMAMELLEKGRTHAEDFYSQKKGKTFAADLILGIDNGRAAFSMEFPKKKR